MAIKTGTMGSLLQGVSQQPDRVRLEGQVTEQINLMSDVTSGLTTRPGTKRVGLLTNVIPDMRYYPIELSGRDFILGTGAGVLKAWEVVGDNVIERNVNFASGASAYFGSEMRFHVVEGKVVAVNRTTSVQKITNTATKNRFLGVVSVLSGQYSRTYRIRIVHQGNVMHVTYTTPDGTNAGDGVKSSTDYIAEQLQAGLIAHPSMPSNVIVGRAAQDHIALFSPTAEFRITVSDGQGGEAIRAVTTRVRNITDLPKYAPHGMVVEVRVSAATEDNYWMRFNSGSATQNALNGFWEEGIWEEHRNPYEDEEFNLSTMPHTIELNGNTFNVAFGEWLPRQVGDSNSAPMPSIVGKQIRDINGFEGRLVLLTPNSVVMSRTNNPFDLWRESATVISATDPIDMTSTKKDDLRFDWLVPFDRDMFIIADPGSSQFVIRGGGVTPQDASMVLTTEYEVKSSGCSPVSTGRTLLLPYSTGNYSGVNEFYTNSDNAAQAANSITETVSSYIQGTIRAMAISPTFSLALVATDSSTFTIWAYKYLWDGQELLQSAWSKWHFNSSVLQMYFNGSRLYLVTQTNGSVYLEYLDLNFPNGPYGYPVSMDSYSISTAQAGTGQYAGYSYIDVGADENRRFLRHTGSVNPGSEVMPVAHSTPSPGVSRKYFDTSAIPVGAQVISGVKLTWELIPTEVFSKDYQGRVDSSRNVVIQEYTVRLENSGPINADFRSKYGGEFTYTEELYPLDNEPAYPGAPYLISEDIIIPWGERSDWSSLRLWGDDYRPVNIIEVQWGAQITSPRGSRS